MKKTSMKKTRKNKKGGFPIGATIAGIVLIAALGTVSGTLYHTSKARRDYPSHETGTVSIFDPSR